MAKDKERSVNPAQAQRKLDKQKALKKGKAEALTRRNEKLARRNPERLQRQIDDLKALEESGQPLRPKDKQTLETLENDLRAVRKAREALGEKAPSFGHGGPGRGQQNNRGRGDGVLGKRRRDGQDRWKQESSGSETDESVRRIPMPRDKSPPIPRQHQQRRRGTDANNEPLGEGRGGGERQPHQLPEKPASPAPAPAPKTVYEAAPAVRDLRQEAVNRFIPAAVKMKQDAAKGKGRLVEPEEMDRLEKEGYAGASRTSGSPSAAQQQRATHASEPKDVDASRLAEEEERFNRELRTVQIEEVEDEDL
ncbi:hypothetical protein FQN54_008752 [Arachnomyces sp. PD_36]|nr:hypothetical protein FQN54_008752 [Arachnomyces sp. PD_36]